VRRTPRASTAPEADPAARVGKATASARSGSGVILTRLGSAAARGWRALPAWTQRPDFLIVLLAGALLRLLWLDSTSFLGDQAELLALARSAVDALALPLMGIRSSIGTLNPPAAIYPLLPLARLDPFWSALFTALANIVAVVLLYRLADRYAGRGAAFAAGLLYATAAAPVWYSRILWQQNFLAPALLLFFWTLCRGVVDHQPRWLGWNVLLWGIAVQLHPTAAPLALLTILGALLTRRALGRRDLLAATLALAVLFLPSALWELVSGGSDLTRLGASASGRSILDWAAIQMLFGLLQPASRDNLGDASLYASAYPAIAALPIVMALLAFASTIWIVAVVVRPFVPGLLAYPQRSVEAAIPAGRRLKSRLNGLRPQSPPARTRIQNPFGSAHESADALLRVSRHDSSREGDIFAIALADPQWRFRALLALWALAPLVVMLRHSQRVYPHYLLVSLPAAFLILGLFLAWMANKIADAARAYLSSPRQNAVGMRPASLAARLAHMFVSPGQSGGPTLLIALTLLLALGQTYGTTAELLAIKRGAFDATAAATAHYGLPLDTQRTALLEAQRAARPLGADVVVATDGLSQEPLGYLATTGYGPANVYESKDCLVAPATGGQPQVTLAITPGVAAGELLPRLQGATSLQPPSATTTIAPALYRLPPGATLPGEVALPAASATPAPRLAGYLLDRAGDGSARLIVHWSGAPTLAVGPSNAPRYFYGASPAPSAPPVAHYRLSAQPLDASGSPLGAALVAECPRLAWSMGESVYAWVAVPPSLAGHVALWRVWAEGAPYLVTYPTLGPLRFVAGDTHEGRRMRLGGEVVIPT
jgi:hypothetical protein